MKATKLKALGHKLGVLSLTALMVVSCGSSNNNDSSSNNNGNSTFSSDPFNTGGSGNTGGNVSGTWNSLKGQTSCAQGRGSDIQLHMTSGSIGAGGRISGTLQSGSGNISGDNSSSYYGRNVNGDLLYVRKVSNNGQITGFNVVLSLCNWNQYFRDGTQYSGFEGYQLHFNDSGTCGIGTVLDGEIRIAVPGYGVAPVRFSLPVNCN